MKMLDLFCGEGLAAWGYWRSGRFSEIVGIDSDPKHRGRYSFDLITGDALHLTYEFLWQFDFIHASPPCQGYSKITPDQSIHPRLIAATHQMLWASGLPYVIENVEGSGQELRPNFVADGTAFGLPMKRRRYFHLSWLKEPERMLSSAPATYSPHGKFASRDRLIDMFGLRDYVNKNRMSYLTVEGIEQGIPPSFTHHIAQKLAPGKFLIG